VKPLYFGGNAKQAAALLEKVLTEESANGWILDSTVVYAESSHLIIFKKMPKEKSM